MISALLLNALILVTTATNKLVRASDVVPKQQQQSHNYFRHSFYPLGRSQPRELLPWDIHFIRGSSKVIYNDRVKQASFDFTRTSVRKDIIVEVYERGCDSIIYPIPGDDDTSMISNIVITDGVEMPASNNDNSNNDNNNSHSVDEVTFKAIVELNDDVQSSPLFYIHDNGETATIDFCLRLALTTGETEVGGNTDVVMSTERIDFKMRFVKVPYSNKYINISSLTGKAALSSEL